MCSRVLWQWSLTHCIWHYLFATKEASKLCCYEFCVTVLSTLKCHSDSCCVYDLTVWLCVCPVYISKWAFHRYIFKCSVHQKWLRMLTRLWKPTLPIIWTPWGSYYWYPGLWDSSLGLAFLSPMLSVFQFPSAVPLAMSSFCAFLRFHF